MSEPMTRDEIDAVMTRVRERAARATGWGVTSDAAEVIAEVERRRRATVASANDVTRLLAEVERLTKVAAAERGLRKVVTKCVDVRMVDDADGAPVDVAVRALLALGVEP